MTGIIPILLRLYILYLFDLTSAAPLKAYTAATRVGQGENRKSFEEASTFTCLLFLTIVIFYLIDIPLTRYFISAYNYAHADSASDDGSAALHFTGRSSGAIMAIKTVIKFDKRAIELPFFLLKLEYTSGECVLYILPADCVPSFDFIYRAILAGVRGPRNFLAGDVILFLDASSLSP